MIDHDAETNYETGEELNSEFDIEVSPQFRVPDDSLLDPTLNKQIQYLMDSITRIGGEVSRMRAEVDGLLEQNTVLLDSFRKLREVIDEKGTLDLDDFELACEVIGMPNLTGEILPVKKIAH